MNTDTKYMALNAVVCFTSMAAGILFMTSQNDYRYFFMVVAIAWVGIRSLKAALILSQESKQ